MAGEIGVAKVSADMLKALWAAHQAGGTAAVAAQVTNIAAQLGTSTQAVWNGVIAAQASSNAVVAGWAGTVAEGVAAGELGLSGATVVAGKGAAPGLLARAGTAIAQWWGGVTATQVVVVAGVLIVVVGGVWWVAGRGSDDPDTAATAVEIPVADDEESGATDGSTSSDDPTSSGEDDDRRASGDVTVYAGDVTLVPGALTVCGERSEVDGNFDLEVLDDGTPVYGDFEIGGNVGVQFSGTTEFFDCENDEVTCRLEFLMNVRVRGGAATYEQVAGRVFGPGHDGIPCDRSDYVEREEDSGPATIELDELTDEAATGQVLLQGVPYLEFSGTRSD